MTTIPFGSRNEYDSFWIENYSYDQAGHMYDHGYLADGLKLSQHRSGHSSNPPDEKGFRYPSDYHIEESHYETREGSRSWIGANGNTNVLKGKLPNWINDHVGTAGPCMDGLSFQADPNNEARAITECLNKLGDVKTSVFSNIATAAQTANLLADTVDTLAQGLMAFRKRSLRKAKDALDSASGLFLQSMYGWGPLTNDIDGAMELLLKANLKPIGKVVRNLTDNRSRTDKARGYSWTSSYTSRSKVALFAEVDDTWARAQSQAGAGIRSIPYGLWDLVPWSFVVDWVMPVGNVLEALSATAGVSFKAGYISHRVTAQASISSIPNPTDLSSSPFGGEFRGEWYNRRVLGGFPLPEPYVKSPFSVTHALESLALLAQMRHGGTPLR